MTFEALGLMSALTRATEAAGFSSPTEIQQSAIPLVLEGKDLMASAQTGTGKTAAFVLPTLQKLMAPSPKRGVGPRALILTPTRELAEQVNQSIKQLSRFLRFTGGTVVGGVPYPPQQRLLAKPLDLLVATPGRLLDHMSRGRVDFSRLEMLILDEADRMLDMGFIEDVEQVAARAPQGCQRLLFSATLEGEILRVATRLLKDPVQVALGGNKQQHKLIEQHVHLADNEDHKQALLMHILADTLVYQAIVFTSTKRGAEQLAGQLSEAGHQAAALHGDLRQNVRNRIVEKLKRGRLRVLVATDVAARGLDARDVTHVVNFDLPMQAEDYIHRVGRTGRAGASGIAVSLVGRADSLKLTRIERLIGRRLERATIAGLEPRFSELPQRKKFSSGHRGKSQGRAGQDNRRPWTRSKASSNRPNKGPKRSSQA